MTTSRRAAPGPPRRRLVEPGLARPGGGAGGGRSCRSAVPSAAQQQKERDGPAAASGAATGGPAGPRAAVRSRSYLSSPAPRRAACPHGARRCCFAAVRAAGRAHVSAGGAGAASARPGRRGGAALTRAPCPRAAARALPGLLLLPLAAAGRPLPRRDPRPRVRAEAASRAWAGPSPGAGWRLGVWFLPLPPSPPPALPCFLGRGGTSSSSLPSTPPPALGRWAGTARLGAPGRRPGTRPSLRAPAPRAPRRRSRPGVALGSTVGPAAPGTRQLPPKCPKSPPIRGVFLTLQVPTHHCLRLHLWKERFTYPS